MFYGPTPRVLALVVGLTVSSAVAQAPKMKMTTEIPTGIATPDKVETRLGTLTSVDGVPDAATAQKVYDNLDFQRASRGLPEQHPDRVHEWHA